jgi:chromosome segregation ATPase
MTSKLGTFKPSYLSSISMLPTCESPLLRSTNLQVRDLQGQLSQGDLGHANAQQNTTQSNQQVFDLHAQLSQRNLDLTNEQQKKAALEQQLNQDRSSLADMTQKFNDRSDRLTYLESQCVKADQLCAEHMRLIDAYKRLRQETDSRSHADTAR